MHCFNTLITLLYIMTAVSSLSPEKSQVVKCAVCRSLVTEFHDAIDKIDPKKKLDIGSYRLEPNGERKVEKKQYIGSEMHLTELMEEICSQFTSDYAQAKHKETGRYEAIKFVIDGKMNPRFGEYELVQDPELNKGLKFHCESIVEDYEDDILKYFKENTKTNREESQDSFCSKLTGICAGIKDEL